jgi:hypothetical protein
MEHFGDVTLAKIRDSSDLRRLLPSSLRGSETVIVKPNWFSPHPANFIDAHALGLLLGALDGKVIIIEGYTLEKQDGTRTGAGPRKGGGGRRSGARTSGSSRSTVSEISSMSTGPSTSTSPRRSGRGAPWTPGR